MLYKVVCFGINVPDKSSPNDEHFLYNVNIPLVIQKRSKAMKLEVQGKKGFKKKKNAKKHRNRSPPDVCNPNLNNLKTPVL